MNCAVGSRKNTSPMERRPHTTSTVRATVAALLIGATLFAASADPARAQNAPATPAPTNAPAKATSSATTTPAAAPAAKKPAAKAGTAAKSTAPTLDTPKAKGSYALGISMGEQLRRNKVTSDAVSTEVLAQGVRDALSGKVQMSSEYQQNIVALIRGAREVEAAPNHAAATTFLAENGKKKDVMTTASGLQYKVITPGAGESPKPTDQVVVNYRGTLLNGTEFDASAKHGGPATFAANQVIPGWQEALGLMKPGAKYQLWIPPKLAYDLDSPPAIPPGSLLIFDVELVSIKPPQAAAAPAVHPQIQPAQPQK